MSVLAGVAMVVCLFGRNMDIISALGESRASILISISSLSPDQRNLCTRKMYLSLQVLRDFGIYIFLAFMYLCFDRETPFRLRSSSV